tara:strand:- start:343 stop:1536 length:1194 start_codon:yes stop_codon:yes gene_type:complete
MDILEKIIRENCWKFDKGYPDSQKDINYLITLIEQQMSLFSDEELADVTIQDIKSAEAELEKKFDDGKLDSSEDLIKALKTANPESLKKYSLEGDELKEVANYIMNRRLRPILYNILRKNNYNDKVLDDYTNKILPIFQNIDDKERDNLISYLQNPTIEFGKNLNGNLYTDFKKIPAKGLPYEQIVRSTFQDERKLGVGMGEVAMSIFFDNITSAVGGGDLAIDNGKFEVKGYNAKLDRDPSNYKADPEDILKLGIDSFKQGKFGDALQDAYAQSKDKEQWVKDFKAMLANGPKLPIDAINTRVNKIDWNDIDSIIRNVGLINFIRYAGAEGFTHFIVLDTGGTSKGEGNYVYVSGSPEDMAQDLYNADVQFQGIHPNLVGGPRMTYSKQNKEEENV